MTSRVGLHVIILLALCIGSGDSLASQEARTDKVTGMMFLGAFGDALGARTEHIASDTNHVPPSITQGILSPGAVFYNLNMTFNPWYIWPPPSEVQDVLGLVTDDTSFRAAITQPWFAAILDGNNKAAFTAENMKVYMWGADNVTLASMQASDSDSWYNTNKEMLLACFVQMFNAADVGAPIAMTRGYNAFYTPGAPACFGLYMVLEPAAAFAGSSTTVVYSAFRNVAGLDQEYGGVITALAAIVISKAVSVPEPTQQLFADWLWMTLLDAITELRATVDSQDLAYLNYIEETLQVGRHYSGTVQTVGEFVDLYLGIVENPLFTPQHAMRTFDPLVFLRAMVMCQTFVSYQLTATHTFVKWSDVLSRTLQLLISIAGDTDTMASQYGLMAGAYYGEKALVEDMIMASAPFDFKEGIVAVNGAEGLPVGSSFEAISSFLVDGYDYDIRTKASHLASSTLFLSMDEAIEEPDAVTNAYQKGTWGDAILAIVVFAIGVGIFVAIFEKNEEALTGGNPFPRPVVLLHEIREAIEHDNDNSSDEERRLVGRHHSGFDSHHHHHDHPHHDGNSQEHREDHHHSGKRHDPNGSSQDHHHHHHHHDPSGKKSDHNNGGNRHHASPSSAHEGESTSRPSHPHHSQGSHPKSPRSPTSPHSHSSPHTHSPTSHEAKKARGRGGGHGEDRATSPGHTVEAAHGAPSHEAKHETGHLPSRVSEWVHKHQQHQQVYQPLQELSGGSSGGGSGRGGGGGRGSTVEGVAGVEGVAVGEEVEIGVERGGRGGGGEGPVEPAPSTAELSA